jgi:hypothetical protein
MAVAIISTGGRDAFSNKGTSEQASGWIGGDAKGR